MMSARSSSSTCSRIAGVRTDWGTSPPYHPTPGLSGSPGSRPVPAPTGDNGPERCRPRTPAVGGSAGHRRRHPVPVGDPRRVPAVGRPEAEAPESLGTPGADPGCDRRPNERPAPDDVGLDDHGIQEAATLQQRNVEERDAIEPEEVDGNVADDVLRARRLPPAAVLFARAPPRRPGCGANPGRNGRSSSRPRARRPSRRRRRCCPAPPAWSESRRAPAPRPWPRR